MRDRNILNDYTMTKDKYTILIRDDVADVIGEEPVTPRQQLLYIINGKGNCNNISCKKCILNSLCHRKERDKVKLAIKKGLSSGALTEADVFELVL